MDLKIFVKRKREGKRILRGKGGVIYLEIKWKKKKTWYKGFEADPLKGINMASGKVMMEVRKPPERRSGS